MSCPQTALAELVRKDPRYAHEAYEFLFAALQHTQTLLGREIDLKQGEASPKNHISGRELLEGVCDFARKQYGLMARAVFHAWGVRRTGDVGDMVFNLIEAELMSKTAEDRREDFEEVFDFDDALMREYPIKMAEVSHE